MLFETEKPRHLYKKKHFETEEVILQRPREQVLYFVFYNGLIVEENEEDHSVTSLLYKICKSALLPVAPL